MHHVTVKALKRALQKAGLKTTGKKAALTRRAKKAHLKMRGGEDEPPAKRARVGPGPEEKAAEVPKNPPADGQSVLGKHEREDVDEGQGAPKVSKPGGRSRRH